MKQYRSRLGNGVSVRRNVRPAKALPSRPLELRSAAFAAAEVLEPRWLLSVSQDSDGWTVVTPASDTKKVYVSSSLGSDTNNGLSPTTPVKTISKGTSLLRDGSPDWLLLNRGDVWNESFLRWRKSGRSAQDPLLITSYGDGARPRIETGQGFGITLGSSTVQEVNFVNIIGLHFYAHTRDPKSSAYQGNTAGDNGIVVVSKTNSFLVEDCQADYYVSDIVLQNFYGPVQNVVVRRNVFNDAYSTTQHSQGLYAYGINGLTIEDNVFDHNGWNESITGAQATIYNHNIYLDSNNTGVVVRRNIIANAGSHGLQARSGGIVQDNLFLRNAIGMSFGFVNGSTVMPGGVTGDVSGNVFLESRDIAGAGRGWAIEVGNIKAGANTRIHDNIFSEDSQKLYPAIMLNIGIGVDNQANSVGINDLTIEDNIVHKWDMGLSTSNQYVDGGTGYNAMNNLIVRNNDFQDSLAATIISHGHPLHTDQEHWSNNRYYDKSPTTQWFNHGGTTISLDAWRAYEPTAQNIDLQYLDPDRTAETYYASIGGDGTLQGFLNETRLQSHDNWRTQYLAPATIGYVRAGFNIDVNPPTASLAAADITSAGGTTQNLTVTYVDDVRVNETTLDSLDLRVTGPGNFNQLATFVSVQEFAGGTTCVATYQVSAGAGGWSSSDNGQYAVTLQQNQVTDQTGNAITSGPLGAYQIAIDGSNPTATVQAANVTAAPGAVPYIFNVTYSDNSAIKISTIGAGDVRVTGPAGFDAPAQFVSLDDPANGSPRVATYSIAVPNGGWQSADNGAYHIIAESNAVTDTSGNVLLAGELGSFQVNVDTIAPTAVLSAANVTSSSSTGETFTVAYDDNIGIDATTFDSLDVRVSGPNNFSQAAAYVSSVNGSGNTRIATYQIAGPATGWTSASAGTYTVMAQANQVADTSANFLAAGTLGTFDVDVDTNTPTAALTASDVTSSSASGNTFTVTFTDDVSIKDSTLDSLDVRVSGPNNFDQPATLVGALGGTAAARIATYKVAGPVGGWTTAANGTYTVSMQPGQVSDGSGNFVPAGAIGTFQVNVDTVVPTASATASDITAASSAAKTFTVTYSDNAAILFASIDSSDVRVTGPGNFNSAATLVAINSPGNGTPRIATYSVAAPAGGWTNAANGSYSIAMQASQVTDTSGNAVAAGTVGAFQVNVPAVVGDVTPPTVLSAQFVSTSPNKIVIRFSETVSPSFTIDDLALRRTVPKAATISQSDMRLTYDAATNTATITFPNFSAGLPKGSYTLTLSAVGITDAAGNALDGNRDGKGGDNYTFSFKK